MHHRKDGSPRKRNDRITSRQASVRAEGPFYGITGACRQTAWNLGESCLGAVFTAKEWLVHSEDCLWQLFMSDGWAEAQEKFV